MSFGSLDEVDDPVVSPVVGRVSQPLSLPSNFTGSFHQAEQFFEYGGAQCMAIAFVSLAKHTVLSVFSGSRKS